MMNYRWNIVLTIAVVALGCALGIALSYAKEQRDERLRLQTNQRALTEELHTFRVRDTLSAASSIALSMRADELSERMGHIARMVGDMGVKLSRVEHLSQSAVSTTYHIASPIVDSSVHLRTPHLIFDASFAKDSLRAHIESIDTLTQVVHRVPKRLWFIRYGTRYLEQTMVSSNPHSRIVYDRYIRVVN